jgi:hypothetical protein
MDRTSYDEKHITAQDDMKIPLNIVRHGKDNWMADVTGH